MKQFLKNNRQELLSAAVIVGVFMLAVVGVLAVSAFEQTLLF